MLVENKNKIKLFKSIIELKWKTNRMLSGKQIKVFYLHNNFKCMLLKILSLVKQHLNYLKIFKPKKFPDFLQ